MNAATDPIQHRPDARLLVIDPRGRMSDTKRSNLTDFLRRGDLVVANDAATLPASFHGLHVRTASQIEVRLAGRKSLSPDDIADWAAVVFGAGDFHTPTEHRPLPPALRPGDRLALGTLQATVTALAGHPRLVSLHVAGSPDAIWSGIARNGRPIQYSHMAVPLQLWDVWTAIAGRPVAFEPPSAGFVLDWATLGELPRHGVEFRTLTHAAGISSTGDEALDALLPFDEPYDIPAETAAAIAAARSDARRIVAIGTTVVRALEHAAASDGVVRAGPALATGRIGAATRLRVVDAIVSGVHEPTTSHYQLLRAFAGADVLQAADALMARQSYRTHEFGDSVLVEKRAA